MGYSSFVETMAPDRRRERERGRHVRCPAERTLAVIGGRWKVPLVWLLLGGDKRPSELRRHLGAVTAKVLTQQLRELERDGVLRRTVYPEVPPKVVYALTARGKSLRPVVEAMCRWGKC